MWQNIFNWIAGIASIISIPVSIYLYCRSKKSEKALNDAIASINGISNKSKNLLIRLRLDFFRLFESVESHAKEYWHFVSCFENWDSFMIKVDHKNEDGRIEDRTYDITILGSSKPSLDLNHTRDISYSYYFVKITKEYSSGGPFQKNDILSCFFYNDKAHISKSVGSLIEPEDKSPFTIVTLGLGQFAYGCDSLAKDQEIFVRLKDS